jgi:DNA-binding protein H-NS
MPVLLTITEEIMASYVELKQQADALFQQAEELRQAEIRMVFDDIREKMAMYGLTVADLVKFLGHKTPAAATASTKPPKPAKYRDKISGKTWSGQGRKPSWMPDDKSSWDAFLI